MSTTQSKWKVIDRATLKAKLDKNEKFQLWNVLGTEWYKPHANIQGSKWLAIEKLSGELIAKTEPKKDALIVTYCGGPQCPASKQAADKLVSLGYTNVYAYEGGLQDWKEGGLPFVSL